MATKHLMVYKCAMVSIPIYVLSLYLVEVMSFPVPNITIFKVTLKYHIVEYFHMCKISQKCCICYRIF